MDRSRPALLVLYGATAVGGSLGALLLFQYPGAGVLAFLAGAVAAPPVRDLASERYGIELSDSWVAFAYPFLLTLLFLYLLVLLPILSGS